MDYLVQRLAAHTRFVAGGLGKAAKADGARAQRQPGCRFSSIDIRLYTFIWAEGQNIDIELTKQILN